MKRIKKILAVIGTAIFVGAALAGCSITKPEVALTQAEYNAKIEAAKQTGIVSVDVTTDNQAVIDEAQASNQAEIDRLNAVIEDYKSVEEEVAAEEEVKSNGYEIDEIKIGDNFVKAISDREVKKLLDTEIEFDDDDYDIEEVFSVAGKIDYNEKDFLDNTYLQFRENDLSYKVEFDLALDTGDITEDETLIFNLLSKEVEVIEWDVDKVTFISGIKMNVDEGKEYTTDYGTVNIQVIADNYVYVRVGDNAVKVKEGDVGKVNGVEIKVLEVLDDDDLGSVDMAEIIVGKDIERTVEDGDDYSDTNEIWKWDIDANSIGISLNENYVKLNDDYEPLAVLEVISLPNDYLTVEYTGLAVDKFVDVRFEDDVDYNVEIKGNFINGLNDYDRLYMNATGFYDKEDKLIGNSVEIENTESNMVIDGNFIKVNDVSIKWTDLTKIKVDGTEICDKEDDYLTKYGIVIDEPENSCDDNDFKISIPEEEQTATITVY